MFKATESNFMNEKLFEDYTIKKKDFKHEEFFLPIQKIQSIKPLIQFITNNSKKIEFKIMRSSQWK